MSNHFEYAGYIGSAEVDVENGTLFGRLLFIRDAIGYHSETVEGLEEAFREAVDDYLAACREDGSEPDVPCKGSFNVRVGPERHRKVAIAARNQGVGLNDFVGLALDKAIEPQAPSTVVHKHQVTVMVAGEERTASTAEPMSLTMSTGTAISWQSQYDSPKH
jgi:predicted HicB family RNase H-like nuclease